MVNFFGYLHTHHTYKHVPLKLNFQKITCNSRNLSTNLCYVFRRKYRNF